jgi:outer membrane biosynthesis protein TonB
MMKSGSFKWLSPVTLMLLSFAGLYCWAQNQTPAPAPYRPDPELDLGFDYQLHAAAYYYAEGDLQTASNAVHRALNILPEDPQAEALRKLIEDQNQDEQDQQQDQDQNQDEQQKQDQNQQDQNQEQSESPNQEQNQQNEEQQQQENQPEQQEQQEQASDQQPQQQKKEDQRMTPEEAKMLLDALRQADMMFPLAPSEDRSYGSVLRDW